LSEDQILRLRNNNVSELDIDLVDKGLNETSIDWAELGQLISKSTNLKKLVIDGNVGRNWKSRERSRKLFKNIAASASIDSLVLNSLGNKAVMFLPLCINNLHCLELWNCVLGFEVDDILVKLIKAPDCKLEKVVFANGDFTTSVKLLEALKVNTSIKSFKFKVDNIYTEKASGAFFSRLLRGNTSLTELDLSHNQRINSEVLTSLVRVLANNTTLTTLRLESLQNVTRDGWRLIATDYIRSPTCALENLYLWGVTLDGDTFNLYVNACQSNRTLKKLCLKLPSNRSLNTRRVGWNPYMNSLMRIVYNKRSIMETYNSNHVLRIICYREERARLKTAMSTCTTIASNLPSALKMNREDDKFTVARRKILQSHYYNQDDIKENKEYRGYKTLMDTILEMTNDMEKTEQLPNIMAWVGRGDDGLSLMYELMQRMPSLCESVGKVQADTSAKRMRVE